MNNLHGRWQALINTERYQPFPQSSELPVLTERNNQSLQSAHTASHKVMKDWFDLKRWELTGKLSNSSNAFIQV
jgi:hypothetical protein